jgi:hypothetical protein
LDAATIAGGYKWVPAALRITEANEPLLSLTCHNAAYWERHNADALRQCVHSRLAAVLHHKQQVKQQVSQWQQQHKCWCQSCFSTSLHLVQRQQSQQQDHDQQQHQQQYQQHLR